MTIPSISAKTLIIEDFEGMRSVLKGICKKKNALALQDLLSGEIQRMREVDGEIRRPSPAGAPGALEKCELRVYRDGIIVIPERSELLRLPVSRLASVGVEKYSLAIRLDDGRCVAISKLGRELEPTRKAIADSLADCRLRSLALLRDLLSESTTAELEPWARATANGKVVKLADLEAGLTGATGAIGHRLEDAGLGEQCRHLSLIGSGEKSRVGLRRRVRGRDSTDDIWTLVPIVSTCDGKAGNAIALEGTDEAQPTHATYFFRIVSRESFRSSGGVIDESDLERAMDATGRALESIDFRREPFALTEEELAHPERANLRHILNLVPGLRELRQRFIGRVVHSSLERWAERTEELLRFNVSALRDDEILA